MVTEVEQGPELRIAPEDDMTSAAPIASIGSGFGVKLGACKAPLYYVLQVTENE